MPVTQWLAGQRITASGLQDLIPLSTTLTVASQAITTHASTYFAISFTDVLSSNNTTMWASGQPTRLVAPYAGTYLVHGGITWPGTLGSADARAELRINGTPVTTAKCATMRGSSGNCTIAISGALVFTADTQYAELFVNQNSGSTTNVAVALGMTRASWATS